MIAGVEMMLERWKQNEGREIEVYDELRLLTSEIISRTAFGSSYLEGKNIFDMLTKLSLIINTNLYKLRLPGISKFWRTRDEIESENLVKGIRNSVMEIIKKREEKVKTGEAEGFGNDFLGVSMIINETLRLYPPVLGLIRKVEKEVQIGQLTLPANMNLVRAVGCWKNEHLVKFEKHNANMEAREAVAYREFS
ncbi:hypothetical protein DKX38_015864 [Salix brachista]|uniref:Cytochrome P450 n=1 Tax=Salix brachista TaxID=2182728 RepID=A0A5N5L8F1_9ROSI|nr:hypothetical protein DKX38_015864 [Salix brachista]